MIFKTIAAVLVCVLLHNSVAAEDQPQSQTQTVDKMQQVLHKAQDKDKAVKITLRKKYGQSTQVDGQSERSHECGLLHCRAEDWENDELCIPRCSAGWSSWSLKRHDHRGRGVGGGRLNHFGSAPL